MKHRRFRIIFPILLGVISLLSSALVFHVLRRMARTMRYKSFAYQIGVAVTYTKNNVDLRHMEENIINSNAACKLPVLDPFHSSVIHFVKDVGKLRCSGVSYSSFENNVLRVEGEDIVSAQYRKIERTPRNDFGVVLSDPVKVQITSRSRVAAKIPKGKQNIIVFFFLRSKVARALADAIQRAHKHCMKRKMASILQSFCFLDDRAICTIFPHNLTQFIDDFTLLLQRYEKVTMQRTQKFPAFALL